MLKTRYFSIFIFLISIAIALGFGTILVDFSVFFKTLVLYLLFTGLYYHLQIRNSNGTVAVDYGVTYSLSFALFLGPLALLIFETIYRFFVYFSKNSAKTADPEELFHTFYNIGTFVFFNSVAFYLYQLVSSKIEYIPFGFWILMICLVIIICFIADIFLIIIFSFLGDIKTFRDAIHFFKRRSLINFGKTAFSNGFLLIFLLEERWELLIGLFLLNYLVSYSFVTSAQSIQAKVERDKFEQMAYTDFLTGIANRAYMDKKMEEIDSNQEVIGIVVADIDNFKKINDSYNHSVGDQVIKHFALTLKNNLSEEDLLFRSGGEEFTFFLRNSSYQDCFDKVEKMIEILQDSSAIVTYNGQNVSINYTASFGLHYGKICDEFPMEKGYILADQLLLQSKQQGRNRLTAECAF